MLIRSISKLLSVNDGNGLTQEEDRGGEEEGDRLPAAAMRAALLSGVGVKQQRRILRQLDGESEPQAEAHGPDQPTARSDAPGAGTLSYEWRLRCARLCGRPEQDLRTCRWWLLREGDSSAIHSRL